jgi:hypothetical protein
VDIYVDNALSFQKKRNETTEWNVCPDCGQVTLCALPLPVAPRGLVWTALAALQRVRGYFTDFDARGNLGKAVWRFR